MLYGVRALRQEGGVCARRRALRAMYGLMFIICLTTAVTEWRRIKAPAYKKILYLFTFPFFMATYIPISVVALFKKVEWKPIEHTAAITLDDLDSEDKK